MSRYTDLSLVAVATTSLDPRPQATTAMGTTVRKERQCECFHLFCTCSAEHMHAGYVVHFVSHPAVRGCDMLHSDDSRVHATAPHSARALVQAYPTRSSIHSPSLHTCTVTASFETGPVPVKNQITPHSTTGCDLERGVPRK